MTFDSAVWTTPLGYEMRVVLARLELVSAGTTASWSSAGGDSDHGPQSGDSNPEFLTYRNRFEAAPDERKRELLEEARQAYDRVTGRGTGNARPAGETEQQATDRMLQATEGWTPAEVAASRFRVSETTVRKARRRTGRNPETGKMPHDPMQARVLSMMASGMTQRSIAMRLQREGLEISQATVSRMCRAKQRGAKAA